ncbi:MAG TPA: hypothetical protein VFH17_04270 [Coriobacteriia bacterium]|nr:hypothetical protein [Coriobacteriia bacterium]
MPGFAWSQRHTTVSLAIVAGVLAVTAGVLVWRGLDAPGASTSASAAGEQPAVQQPAGSGGQAPPIQFDVATAPAVPDGQTPLGYLTAYYEACAAGAYETAFSMLPIASQRYYGDAATFEETLRGYGIDGYSVDEPVETADTVSVVGWQTAQGMRFGYEWTFVKADDGTWRVKSRTMAGT